MIMADWQFVRILYLLSWVSRKTSLPACLMGLMEVYGNGDCSDVLQNNNEIVIYVTSTRCKPSPGVKACMKQHTL